MYFFIYKSNDFYKAKSCSHARLAIKLLKIAEKETLSNFFFFFFFFFFFLY